MEETDSFEKLRQAIGNSAAHQERLKDVRTEGEFLSALEDIAAYEGIAYDRAEIETVIATAKHQATTELSDAELESISGGWKPPGGWGLFIGVSIGTAGLVCLHALDKK